jgi:DNA-binding transcriptional regulator YiaG
MVAEENAMPKTELNIKNLAKAPFGIQISILRQLFDFSQNDFADLLGVSARTVQRWENEIEEITPQDAHKRAVQALRTIAESLDDLFEPDMIKVWVDRPNPALQGERPRDYAKKPGGIFIMAHLLGNLGR